MPLWGWFVLAALLALRVPSLVQPAAADQSLYVYGGQRILAGDVPYVHAWDQKPPGIHALYAALWWIWPNEAVVAAADLGAAVLISLGLVVVGVRLASPATGLAAACLFALFANPSLQRLSGAFVRGQCESFMALAITAAMAVAIVGRNRRSTLVTCGVLLGLAIWLKYNAVVYFLPIVAATALASSSHEAPAWRVRLTHIGWIAAGAAITGTAGLLYFAAQNALVDLWLATVQYNLNYAAETYAGSWSVLSHAIALPFAHGRVDFLWFLGGIGVGLGLLAPQIRPVTLVAGVWIAAAVASIGINGARDLPQYFVQAAPALALAGGAGLAGAWQSPRRSMHVLAVGLVLIGLWRVGSDTPGPLGIRMAGVPGLAANIRWDLDYLTGATDRETYLQRFGGQRTQDKFVALEVETLSNLVKATTDPDDSVLVFGFAPGIHVKSGRRSASRFYWSRPVVVDFASDRPGYGERGLLADLTRERPILVVLQKRDWAPFAMNSMEYFLSRPALAEWLSANYDHEQETGLFTIWRRRN